MHKYVPTIPLSFDVKRHNFRTGVPPPHWFLHPALYPFVATRAKFLSGPQAPGKFYFKLRGQRKWESACVDLHWRRKPSLRFFVKSKSDPLEERISEWGRIGGEMNYCLTDLHCLTEEATCYTWHVSLD